MFDDDDTLRDAVDFDSYLEIAGHNDDWRDNLECLQIAADVVRLSANGDVEQLARVKAYANATFPSLLAHLGDFT